MINLLSFLAKTDYSSGEPTYLFNTSIHLYAICILIGVAIALWLGLREAKNLGIASDDIYLPRTAPPTGRVRPLGSGIHP